MSEYFGIMSIPPSASIVSWVSAPYFFDTYANLNYRKKILTPYQILYTLLTYMYKLIKDIKYQFQNSHTILMLLCVNNCL